MTRRPNALTLLGKLERVAHEYGAESAAPKRDYLAGLEKRPLPTAKAVARLHEVLCFLRAYPDDLSLARQVDRMLDGFDQRADLRRHRRALTDTGIAGTDIHYRFFWFTAAWLAKRWPQALHIDWPEFSTATELEPWLRLLVPANESAALDDFEWRPRRWLDTWRGARVTDAAFLVERFAALHLDHFGREALYERIDPPLRLAAGPGTPSRTRARAAGLPMVFRTRAFEPGRPDLRRAAQVSPRAIHSVPRRQARAFVNLAREAMVTRSRDLDSFEHADLDDVRRIDCGDGLQLVCIGLIPERRALLDAIYGYLTLQNGVPIGYVLSSALFGSALVAYNVFETFRGAQAAWHYGRVLGMVRALFGADTFAVDPYQLGHDNAEGQASGAWWFYFKLGLQPRDPAVQRLARREMARVRTSPGYRSSRATLQQLSAAHLFLSLGRERADVLGSLALGNVSLRITDILARSAAASREASLRECAREAGRRLGTQAWQRGSAGERLAWERWSPIVLLIADLDRWSPSERADLVAVIRSKGGRRETDFASRFDAHRRLRRAIVALARPLGSATGTQRSRARK